jgi:predicted XRE-type DNA-binding protein
MDAEVAAFFSETHPRMSNLMNGEIDRFSADKLINMLAKAGMEIRVEVFPKVA